MEKRQNYRVLVEEDSDLEVNVRCSRGTVSGQLIDVGLGGVGFATLSFGRLDDTVFAVGEKVELHFTSSRFDTPLMVTARVANRLDREGTRRYGLQFLDLQRLEGQLSPKLYGLFNRRAGFRVKPSLDDPISVTMEAPDGGQAEGRLFDISAEGAGVRARADAENVLATTNSATISFTLPDSEPLYLPVVICNRRLTGELIHYGVNFDFQHNRLSREQQREIVQFVMQRQRQKLARKCHTR